MRETQDCKNSLYNRLKESNAYDSESQLMNEMIAMMAAGTETVSFAVVDTLYHLSTNKDKENILVK